MNTSKDFDWQAVGLLVCGGVGKKQFYEMDEPRGLQPDPSSAKLCSQLSCPSFGLNSFSGELLTVQALAPQAHTSQVTEL